MNGGNWKLSLSDPPMRLCCKHDQSEEEKKSGNLSTELDHLDAALSNTVN